MDQNKIKLDSIEEAINDFREGKFIVVVDDEDRENEGDLIIAAEKSLPTTSISCLRTQEGCCAHQLRMSAAESSTCHIKWRTTPRCSARRLP